MGNTIYNNAAAFRTREQSVTVLTWSETCFRKAVELSKNSPDMLALCLFELGNVLRMLHRYDEAIPAMKRAVELTHEPNNKQLRAQRLAETAKEAESNKIPDPQEIQTREQEVQRVAETVKTQAAVEDNNRAKDPQPNPKE